MTLLIVGVGFAGFGFLRPGRVDRREVGIQSLAFIVFSTIALTAMMSGPVLAALLAAGAAIVTRSGTWSISGETRSLPVRWLRPASCLTWASESRCF